MKLTGKIALVTGCSRGIGKAIAIELAKNGATVIGADYNQESADSIQAYFNDLDLPGFGVVMDVTQEEAVKATIDAITKTHGAPNILVNNAGITRDNLMLRMSLADWNQVLATNLTAVFHLSQLCVRNMIKARWGRIVNLTSFVAYAGNAGQANYAAAKAGMVALSKSLAQEIASRNVTVNCVAPGYIETDMTKKLSAEQREAYISAIPMRRAGQPEEVAKAVNFLVSDDAAYITGSTIHINGGMGMF